MQVSREAFLAAVNRSALPFEIVPVPELGEGATMRVQGLMMHERTKWEMSVHTGKGPDRQVNARIVRETLLLKTLTDEAGAVLFREDDRDAIGRLGAKVGERLFEASRRVCGMTAEDVAELGNA